MQMRLDRSAGYRIERTLEIAATHDACVVFALWVGMVCDQVATRA